MRSWSQPHLAALVVLSVLACERAAPGGAGRAADVPGGDAALIRNATSAAPEAVADEVTVMAVGDQGQLRTLRQGSSELTCFPDDPAAPRNVPMCFDRAGLAWAQAWMTKQAPPADLPIGVAYMLQGSWTQSNADPHAAPAANTPGVTTGPALMILNTRGMLRGHPRDASNPARPFVMWPDTPYEHLMVPVAGRTR